MTIFQFDDYKAFTAHEIGLKPKRGRGEVSRIAASLRVSSTLISQILSGEKHFTLEQAEAMTEYLGLVSLDADYYILLVHRERAGTDKLRRYYSEKIRQLREDALRLSKRVKVSRELTEQERGVFYSSPFYAAIWLYTSVGPEGQGTDEIALKFALPKTKVTEILRFLLEVGLCLELHGKYRMGTQSTHVGQASPHMLNHHRNWRLQAIQQSERLTESELMYSGAVSLSREDFQHLREEMVLFIKNFLKKAHASPAEDVACFNMDFFWVRP